MLISILKGVDLFFGSPFLYSFRFHPAGAGWAGGGPSPFGFISS